MSDRRRNWRQRSRRSLHPRSGLSGCSPARPSFRLSLWFELLASVRRYYGSLYSGPCLPPQLRPSLFIARSMVLPTRTGKAERDNAGAYFRNQNCQQKKRRRHSQPAAQNCANRNTSALVMRERIGVPIGPSSAEYGKIVRIWGKSSGFSWFSSFS